MEGENSGSVGNREACRFGVDFRLPYVPGSAYHVRVQFCRRPDTRHGPGKPTRRAVRYERGYLASARCFFVYPGAAVTCLASVTAPVVDLECLRGVETAPVGGFWAVLGGVAGVGWVVG